MQSVDTGDPVRRAATVADASAAVALTIRRAEASRDELSIVRAYALALTFALTVDRPLAECRDLATKGEAALMRSGRAMAGQLELGPPLADLELREGKLDQAAERLRALVAPWHRWSATPGIIERYARVLGLLGRDDEVVGEMRAELATSLARFGPDHPITIRIQIRLASALAAAGHAEEALTVAGEAVSASTALGKELVRFGPVTQTSANPPTDPAPGPSADPALVAQLGIAAAAHRAEVARGAMMALIHNAHEPRDVAMLALGAGYLEAFHLVVDERLVPVGNDREVAEARYGGLDALAAYVDGDLDALAATGNPAYRAYVDAATGHREAAERYLAAHPGGDLDGVVRVALGDWKGARAALEARRASDVGRDDVDRAEIDAWLGVAQLEGGDASAAVTTLEESFEILNDCCRHFHSFAPMAELALAKALWATGGDKARARMMATYSRDHAARMPHRAAEREAAEAWLAAHPG